MSETVNRTPPLIRHPEQGRHYPMGRMTATFIADNDETAGRMSVSEWWLEPNTGGPPAHAHPEDHLFLILPGGDMALYLEGTWHSARAGSYVYIPGGTEHTFENRSGQRAGLLSVNTPGGFETQAAPIAQWFQENPLGDASTRDD